MIKEKVDVDKSKEENAVESIDDINKETKQHSTDRNPETTEGSWKQE